jgi:hypothetical protein
LRGEGRVRGFAAAGGEDGVTDAIQALRHLAIGKSKHRQTKPLKVMRACIVVGYRAEMHTAIQFDHQSGIPAEEVDDI